MKCRLFFAFITMCFFSCNFQSKDNPVHDNGDTLTEAPAVFNNFSERFMDSVQKCCAGDDRIYMIKWMYSPFRIENEGGDYFLVCISGSELQKIPWDTLILRSGINFNDQKRDSVFKISGLLELNECFFHDEGDPEINIASVDLTMGDYNSDCAVLLQNTTGKTLKKVMVLTKIVTEQKDTLIREQVDLIVDVPPRSARRVSFTFHKINNQIFSKGNLLTLYSYPTYLIDYTLE